MKAIAWPPDTSPPWPLDDTTVQVPAATRPSMTPPKRRNAVSNRLSAISSFRILWDLITEGLGCPDGSPDLRLAFRDTVVTSATGVWLRMSLGPTGAGGRQCRAPLSLKECFT